MKNFKNFVIPLFFKNNLNAIVFALFNSARSKRLRCWQCGHLVETNGGIQDLLCENVNSIEVFGNYCKRNAAVQPGRAGDSKI